MSSAASASDSSASTGRTHPTGVLIAGRFRIEASLGRGATGSVYRVRDEHSGKKLALKQLRIANVESSALLASQFEREYHTLCQLAHPSIIEVYDYGLDNTDPFYTMELLDGEDLRERGRTTWRQACALLRDVASSLAILHSRRLLHRDISARNVRCTSDGRAKLIDFGAMMPMGVAKHLFGTPPFVPPEALQLQALDARADLYALGALAYHMLTGTYAYAARTLEQLPDAWRTRPQSPRVVAADIPIALEQLVMQLMHLDRAQRPASAAEVMERLSGIAGTPLVERVEVTRAYLATPVLVGRDAPLRRVREQLSAAVRGEGGSLVIEGAAGVGRSRFLDACVLEAKLLGCIVLRGDASDRSGDYGLTKSLFAQLFRAVPELVERHARPSRSILCHMLPRLDPEHAKSQPLPERRHLQAAVRDFLLSIARGKRLVIAVDDADRSDEPSAALLAALAHGAKRRSLSLLMTLDATLRPSSGLGPAQARGELASPHALGELASLHALEVARDLGSIEQLSALTPEQTESLVRSLFGDVDHVAALASRIHGLSQGNPRAAMALAEHLVERGVARYEAGSWALPAELIAGDLPESLAAELAARVSALPADARELAETLALTDPAVFSLEDYRSLSEHGDHGRTYRALDALLAVAILVPSGNRYRFAQRELVDLLCAAQSPERARALHERIAHAVEGCDEPALYPHHLLLAGKAREAIAHLLPLRNDPRVQVSSPALTLPLLERAVLASQQLELPLRAQFDLRAWLLNVAAYVGQYDIFTAHYSLVLSRCEQDSGLCEYAALDHLPPEARLTEALTRAEQRYRATPEAERGLSPIEAIAQLGRLCGTVVIMASVVQDIELVARLPSLLPFAVLGPGLLVVQGLIDGMLDFQGGRIDDAGQKYVDVLARIDRPDRGGIEAAQLKPIRLGVLYMQGVIAAARGQASALEWVAELEQEPGYRENAWRVRRTYELMRGDDEAAAQCQRRAELFALQDGQHQHFPGTPARIELLAHTYRDNLLGVKRAMERLESSATRYRGWRPTFAVARAQYRRLQGDSQGALEALAPALSGTTAGRHLDWGLTVSTHVVLLNELGRRQQAIDLGFQYLATWRHERLQRSPSYRTMQRALSDALIHSGRLEDAVRIADDSIRESLEAGVSGFFLGLGFEARARVAIASGDHDAVREFADRCALEAKRGRSGLSAKYERLLQEAHSSGITLTNHLALLPATPDSIVTHSTRTAHDRLLECVDDRERARVGLRLLLEACAAQSGFLFGLRDGRFTLLANSEPTPPAQELFDLLDAHLRSLLAAEQRKTQPPTSGTADESQSQRLRFVDADGRCFEPLLIASRQSGEAVLGALAALCYAGDERIAPSRALLEAVAAALLDHDDVDAVTCIA